MKRELNVYLHQAYAGRLTRDIFGTMSFTYDSAYVEQNLPALSLSLPLRQAPYRGNIVNGFFFGQLPGFLSMRCTWGRLTRRWLWGCLPDQLVRSHKKKYIGLTGWRQWAWLAEKGMEAGAISLHQPEDSYLPSTLGREIEIVLDGKAIIQISKDSKSYASVFGKYGMIPARIDEQTRVVFVKGRSPTLSTHFAKYIGERNNLALNEFFCMRLARSVGLIVPDVELRTVDENLYYLIERYDRAQSSPAKVEALHQESLCQALGVPVGVWLERHGGPGIKAILGVLHEHSARPEQDKAEFLARLVFGYLVGCLDINGRNVSLLYRKGFPELAPAYDLSVSAPSDKLAMSIGGVRRPEEVCLRHWYSVVEDDDKHILQNTLDDFQKNFEEQANKLVNEMEREDLQSEIYGTILARISQRTGWIRKELRS
ncbi:MAG: HipA domain-containing protein [Gammaproteobacteria bacterium]|nr:HipA domain-containing protein [Gammaproteobacteria bacterium]